MSLSLFVGLVVAASTALTLLSLLLPSRFRQEQGGDKALKHAQSVQVLVLGDIGRSPRMQYHALSIAQRGGRVQLIGYLDSNPLPTLLGHQLVTIVPISGPPRILQTSNRLLFAIVGPLKVVSQIWSLWQALAYRTTPARWLLVQNPPSIPTLAISAVICSLRSTKLLIDWHNFGYSILSLKLGPDHPFVQLSTWYEQVLAKAASAHFTVTDAMGRVLRQKFKLQQSILTLHDRPAPQFLPMTAMQKRSFWTSNDLLTGQAEELLQKKTRLLVSSTSWTPDEDFSILLEALSIYSGKAISPHSQLPQILTIITGKGPLKEMYIRRIEQFKKKGKLKMVDIKTAWLSFADYASLLGAADLGVSLHTSSSGVDLPMKVVDMFGAGLPVAGWCEFEAWPELVSEGINGRGFTSANQLADVLVELFDPNDSRLAQLKEGAVMEGRRRWDQEWDSVAGKLFGFAPN